MAQVKRNRITETKVRQMDAVDIVEWVHKLEDEIAAWKDEYDQAANFANTFEDKWEEARAEVARLREAVKGRDETIMHILKREERLRETLKGMRRSDGQGGFLNCWCDSEYDHLRVRPHAPYCITARRALEADDE